MSVGVLVNIKVPYINFSLINKYKIINLPTIKVPVKLKFYLKLSKMYNMNNNNIIDLQCLTLDVSAKILQLIRKEYIIENNYYMVIYDDIDDPIFLTFIDISTYSIVYRKDCGFYDYIYNYQMKNLKKWYGIIK